jgi:HAD superfamily hydrolase (TIGR01458 family)
MKLENIDGFLFDLDGVLFVGNKVIDGAIETIDFLKNKKFPLRFLTNTTTRSHDSLFQKIQRLNLPINKDEILTPPRMAVKYLKKLDNPKLLLILEEETKTEFDQFTIDEKSPDYIILGHYGNRWNYDLLNKLFKMIMNGSKILALHKGRYWQTDEGLTLDIGTFVAGLEHATSQKAVVIGKPSPEFFRIALSSIDISPQNAVMVGDDIINDIKGAQEMGMQTILVKTGKFRQDILETSNINPSYVVDSIASLQDIIPD